MDARRDLIRSSAVRALSAAVCAGAALALGGCSAAVNPGTPVLSVPRSAPTSATVSAASVAADVAAEVAAPPAFPATPTPSSAAPSAGAALTVTDIQVTSNDGFDRVVYEMSGNGLPGWTVGYVSHTVQDGSGLVLDVDGRGVLWVAISGSGYPSQTGATPFRHPTAVRGESTTAVTEVHGWTAFEGTTESFIGTVGRNHSFRVFLCADPVRVVVDVAHTSD